MKDGHMLNSICDIKSLHQDVLVTLLTSPTFLCDHVQEISLHEKKINTLSLEPGSEHLLATGQPSCCLVDTWRWMYMQSVLLVCCMPLG